MKMYAKIDKYDDIAGLLLETRLVGIYCSVTERSKYIAIEYNEDSLVIDSADIIPADLCSDLPLVLEKIANYVYSKLEKKLNYINSFRGVN